MDASEAPATPATIDAPRALGQLQGVARRAAARACSTVPIARSASPAQNHA